MTAPSQDPYRKLAEAICDHVNFGPEEFQVTEVARMLVESLPELSGVLGELAVAREAINCALLRTMAVWSEDRESEVGFDGSDVEAKLSSALSSDSGRLAGEALRAWIRFHLGAGPNYMGADPLREPGEATAVLLGAFPGLRTEVERG